LPEPLAVEIRQTRLTGILAIWSTATGSDIRETLLKVQRR
jgi:hypothetical protein